MAWRSTVKRYKSLAQFLNQHDISITADDHRGHGVTGSKANSLYHFADKNGWNKLIDDQRQLITHLAKQTVSAPDYFGSQHGFIYGPRFLSKIFLSAK